MLDYRPVVLQLWSLAPATTAAAASADDDEEQQLAATGEEVVQLFNQLHRLLQTYDYSLSSLKIASSTLAALASSVLLDMPALDALCNLLKSLARRSMSEVIFDNEGTVLVLDIVSLYAAPAYRLDSPACRLVFNKLLEVYVTRNAACHQRRLSPSTQVRLLQAVAAMGRLATATDWSTWPADVSNRAGILDSALDMEGDEERPKLACLPRFLAHPAQRVRVEAARHWLQQHPPDLRVLPRVFEDLWQREVNTSWTQQDLEMRTR